MLTRIQFELAYYLANAFRHHWACLPEKAYKSIWQGNLADPKHIANIAARELSDTDPWGICAPSLDDNDTVEHTTGTGRLHWTVSYDGIVTFEIHRPEGCCAKVCVQDGRIIYGEANSQFLDRHERALRQALWAIGIPSDALKAFVSSQEDNVNVSWEVDMWDRGREDLVA